jgi:hypothetical protein
MQKYTIVTALYNIYPTSSYTTLLWERLSVLTKYFHVVVFCGAADEEKVRTLTNVTPVLKELSDMQTYKLMVPVEGLPTVRTRMKDTREYMILMNAKVEFLALASEVVAAEYYVWLDAGVSKIVSSPDVFIPFRESLDRYSSDCIRVPGVWGKRLRFDIQRFVSGIYWRFCGGQIIVPRDKVSLFLETSLEAIQCLITATNTLTWEINVWAFMEVRMPDFGILFEWIPGDHNDTMFAPF